MTPLRFRAWHKHDQQMLDVKRIDFEHVMVECRLETSEALRRVILMQSTGLKDKNGVEIFEGDIVRYCGGKPRDLRYHPLRWIEKDRYRFVIRKSGMETKPGLRSIAKWPEKWEVVGNIYQNPELLPQAA